MKGGFKVLGLVLALVALAAVLAATASGQKIPAPKDAKGSITADGSSTVGPYTTATAELFRRAGAKTKITVGISGTGGGFERFCAGETDISDASRPIRASEALDCKENNIGSWRVFQVANDALTVAINEQNTWATCLSVEELNKVWAPGSNINNWKDVRPGFPDVPLKLYGAGTDSGTFDYFTEAINGRSGSSRTDYSASEDDNVLVQGLQGDRGAMAYFGYSYYEENKNNMKALQIRNPKTNQCVTPSADAVLNGSYKPLGRPLFIYVKGSSFGRPEVQSFISFMLQNERAIAARALFVPLSDKQLKRSRTQFILAVKAAARGT
jgi:phosphate transport system substrate-binding protein